jgi:phosphoadenosine phosphosulfate reductase
MTAVAKPEHTHPTFNDVVAMDKEMGDASAGELLRWALNRWDDRLVIASSFGAEDVVLIDLVANINPNARIFTIDTGRLPQETYDVMERLRHRYDIEFEVYFPKAEKVQELVRSKGPNSFYNSIDNRKECCAIRKVEPLQRALGSSDAWVTGIRRDQSPTRAETPKVELDLNNGNIVKVNPLVEWSEDDVWNHIRDNDVPYNTLHDCGYPSIGCAPCTRAIKPGEDVRAGRWWWEDPDTRECGLHARASTDSSKL